MTRTLLAALALAAFALSACDANEVAPPENTLFLFLPAIEVVEDCDVTSPGELSFSIRAPEARLRRNLPEREYRNGAVIDLGYNNGPAVSISPSFTDVLTLTFEANETDANGPDPRMTQRSETRSWQATDGVWSGVTNTPETLEVGEPGCRVRLSYRVAQSSGTAPATAE